VPRSVARSTNRAMACEGRTFVWGKRECHFIFVSSERLPSRAAPKILARNVRVDRDMFVAIVMRSYEFVSRVGCATRDQRAEWNSDRRNIRAVIDRFVNSQEIVSRAVCNGEVDRFSATHEGAGECS